MKAAPLQPSPLPLVVLTDADADAGPVPPYHPAAIIRHQKSAATPNITTTGWDMVKCGLGHAVPNTAIDRPSAPPFDAAASMGNRSGRQMFAYGCPLSKMDISLILSVYAPWPTDCWGPQCLHRPHSLHYIVH